MSATTSGSLTNRPRLRFMVNGVAITGAKSAEVTQTNYAQGSTWHATVAIDLSKPLQTPWWDPTAVPVPDIDFIMQFGLLPAGAAEGALSWQNLIQGLVDEVRFDPIRGLLDISGRDYLAKLLDTRITEAWLNKTSGEVLALLIQAAGLTADVQIIGSVTGQYYQIAHVRSALTASHRFNNAFDLARFLCNAEGCDMWADGKTIRVRKSLSDTSSPFLITYQAPGAQAYATLAGIRLDLERNLLIAKGTVVRVLSWDSRQKKTVDKRWPATGSSGTTGTNAAASGGTLHTFKRPNLTADQATALAHQLYDQIVAHQRTVTYEMPGEFALTPRQPVRLSGTGTTWDGALRIDSITRSLDVEGGFRQSLTLRNRDVTEDENAA
jgi:hypothetical protein